MPIEKALVRSRMVSYKKIGFVNTREMFKKAMAGHYAIPAYNFNNMEQLQGILKASAQTKSPVIIAVSSGARDYADPFMLRHLAAGGVEMVRNSLQSTIPIALHLDHGKSYELCVACIRAGFSSVMIDGSHLPYEENVALTKKVVDYAHKYDVTVEGELGQLKGIEDAVSAEKSTYTRPEDVLDFVSKTGVDSLAISIGTSHGAYKFTDGVAKPLRIDILQKIEKELPGFPIVLHGSSSVPQYLVDIINANGGALKKAVGIPEAELREAAKSAVCKINVDTDLRLAMTAAIRTRCFASDDKGRAEFDPRKFFGLTREFLFELIKYKNESVFGCAWRG